MLTTASLDLPGHCEVKRMVSSNGGSTTVCTPRQGGIECGPVNAGERERERWKDLSNGLSEYYNSPGRLAVVRRRFESASRRPGMDPATSATELGILAVRGF